MYCTGALLLFAVFSFSTFVGNEKSNWITDLCQAEVVKGVKIE